MYQKYNFTIAVLFLPLCQCFYVEISLIGEKNKLKIVCAPPAENLNIKKKQSSVLWHGSQFGSNEHQKISEVLQADVLLPNITINSTRHHLCYLLTDEENSLGLFSQKKRVMRDDSLSSIPAENGVCRPGYRIDQDRCFPCFPGSYTSGQETECILCPKDFYMDKKGADSCWPCPGGKKTLAQGADSEDSCVYFDETGHAISQSPPWIAIYILIGIIILCVWIALIILLVRYWREWRENDTEQVERVERRPRSSVGGPLLRTSSKDDHVYESISDYDSEDNIYAEIGDYYDDDYEVPRRPSDPHDYVDLDAPPLPPKRRRYSSLKDKRENVNIGYEIPIKRESEEYEIPIKNSSDDQYEIPMKNSSDDQYEIPIKKSSDDQYEIARQRSSDSQYEIPLRRGSRDPSVEFPDDVEKHLYHEVKNPFDELNNLARSDSSIIETCHSGVGLHMPENVVEKQSPKVKNLKHFTQNRKQVSKEPPSKRISSNSKETEK